MITVYHKHSRKAINHYRTPVPCLIAFPGLLFSGQISSTGEKAAIARFGE